MPGWIIVLQEPGAQVCFRPPFVTPHTYYFVTVAFVQLQLITNLHYLCAGVT